MILKYLLAGAAMAASLVGAAAASAQVLVLGTEDPVTGFNGPVFPFITTDFVVASDGESPFDPFHAGYDTSDGINFDVANVSNIIWTQAADSHWTFLGGQAWVLPANLGPCGSENEPACEPVGHFVDPVGDFWDPHFVGTNLILEPNGAVSDRIVLSNGAHSGELFFFSDAAGVPEPATWALMLTGFGLIGAGVRAVRAQGSRRRLTGKSCGL
jgi:hypothetical protein